MVTLKQYNGSTIQPTDDAVLYDTLLGVSGVIQGAACTIVGANQIRVATGRIMVCGRMVAVDNDLVNANISPSGTKPGRLILRVDMANTETPAYFTTQVGNPLPELVQEDINTDGLIYEFEMATYTAEELAISNIKDTAYRLSKNNDYRNMPGIIELWPGSTAPEGWLLCNGQAVSRTTYANLFSVLGTTYGQGDGSTTFNVPDLTGRVPMGTNGTYPLASKGGETAHTLSEAELPAVNGYLEFHNIYTGTNLGDVKNAFSGQRIDGKYRDGGSTQTGASSYGIANLNFGQDSAHNNLQPYLAQNYIIKY